VRFFLTGRTKNHNQTVYFIEKTKVDG